MVKMEVGMLARSKAGHDRNRLYVIDRIDAEYVWLVDGVHHTTENPVLVKQLSTVSLYTTPENPMNAMANRPAVMSAIGVPFMP